MRSSSWALNLARRVATAWVCLAQACQQCRASRSCCRNMVCRKAVAAAAVERFACRFAASWSNACCTRSCCHLQSRYTDDSTNNGGLGLPICNAYWEQGAPSDPDDITSLGKPFECSRVGILCRSRKMRHGMSRVLQLGPRSIATCDADTSLSFSSHEVGPVSDVTAARPFGCNRTDWVADPLAILMLITLPDSCHNVRFIAT